MTTAGATDRRVTILRRPLQESDGGNDRGEYAVHAQLWGAFRPLSARVHAELGYAEDVVSGTLEIRESSRLAGLSSADRIQMGDQEWGIDSVPPSDRSGFRKLRISRRMG